jgi:hypothetical protein
VDETDPIPTFKLRASKDNFWDGGKQDSSDDDQIDSETNVLGVALLTEDKNSKINFN